MQHAISNIRELDVIEAAVEDLWVEQSEVDPTHPTVRGVCLGTVTLLNTQRSLTG